MSPRSGTIAPSDLDITAHHEAGHLVAALYNGIDLRGTISAEPDGDESEGHTGLLHLPPFDLEEVEAWTRLVTVYVAGDAAERRLQPRKRRPPPLQRGDVEDRMLALDRMEEVFDDNLITAGRILAHADRRALSQVTKLWHVVQAVAEALKLHGTVDAQDMRNYGYTLITVEELTLLARRTGKPLSWLLDMRTCRIELRRASGAG